MRNRFVLLFLLPHFTGVSFHFKPHNECVSDNDTRALASSLRGEEVALAEAKR